MLRGVYCYYHPEETDYNMYFNNTGGQLYYKCNTRCARYNSRPDVC